MPRTVFDVPEVLRAIKVIDESEESRFTDVRGWETCGINIWSEKAVLAVIEDDHLKVREVWLPISQLRKAEDNHSVYASNWILKEKGLV